MYKMKNKELVIVLGAMGDLGSAFVKAVPNKYDVIGIDKIEKNSHLNLTSYIVCDFSLPESIQNLIPSISVNVYSKIYIVNCMGIFGDESFSPAKSDDEVVKTLYQTIQVNLTGVAHFLLLFLRKHSLIPIRVVLVGSTASHVGSRDLGYGASKAGLNGLIVSLSKTLSSKNLEIMGINPGIFDTKQSTIVSQERRQQAIKSLHIDRIPKLEEVLNLLYYTTFEAPNYLTGSIIKINAGQYV